MENSALFEALQNLSATESRAARRWVESPAFNIRREPLLLFNYFTKCVLEKKPPVFGEISKILGTTDEKRVRRETSELLGLLRQFFAWQELQREPARLEILQLKAARRRGLEKNFDLALRETEKAKSKIGEATIARHLIDFQLDMEKYEHEFAHRRGQEFPFEKLTENLNAWYAGQLMQLSCMDKAQGAVHRRERSAVETWVGPVVGQLPGRPHENQPSVALFYLGNEMFSRPDDAACVADFRKLFEKNIAQLPPDEAKGLLMLAINHGIRRINEGDREALLRTLDFYLLGLESKLLLDERGSLPKYTYNNVLMTFLAMQDWQRARDFLEKYRPQLAAAEQENVYRYNLAIYHFRRGDFDATLELLRDVHFPDPMYNLESRKMLLKIYFEQENFTSLESLLDNLMTWLRRHGEIGYHREMYRNLARFTARLLRLPKNDLDGRKRLKKKVLETPLVAERGWLLEKIGG